MQLKGAGGDGRRRRTGVIITARRVNHRLVEVGSPRSLTIPNPKCPECGCRVFFYQNEDGSRVFFDDLGPPWPKHPCTDNSWYDSPASGKIVAAGLEEERPRRKVAVEEWRPCVIYRKSG